MMDRGFTTMSVGPITGKKFSNFLKLYSDSTWCGYRPVGVMN
jgi:hypothetical protein